MCVIKISGVKVYVLGLFGDIWVRVFTGEYKRTGMIQFYWTGKLGCFWVCLLGIKFYWFNLG